MSPATPNRNPNNLPETSRSGCGNQPHLGYHSELELVFMLCITRHETDPYFNLAAEEYVMDHFDRDVFMLWRNAPAIIVGRHQNTLAEINLDYVRENNLPVVRRLSGGGAVFHDLRSEEHTSELQSRENLVCRL